MIRRRRLVGGSAVNEEEKRLTLCQMGQRLELLITVVTLVSFERYSFGVKGTSHPKMKIHSLKFICPRSVSAASQREATEQACVPTSDDVHANTFILVATVNA